MTTTETREQAPLPAGYTVRPPLLDDAKAVADLWTVVSAHMGQPEQGTEEKQRSSWTQPGFNLTESALVVEDAAGQIVAYAALFDVIEPPVYPWLSARVHPEHEDSGLFEYLMGWLEAKAERIIERCPPDARVALRTFTAPEYKPSVARIEALGYSHIRNFLRMIIHMEQAPPQPTLPEGIIIRAYQHPDELDALIRADQDGFRDHWGFVEQPFEAEKAQWIHWLETDELFDPSLFFLAIDEASGEIAAVCLCRKEQEEDPSVAYVDSLAVRRPWRKRGVGLALLHHCFGEFWRRGRKSVALHVDAASLTGATKLYEKAGMHRDQLWSDFEKVIRDGVEVATTSL